MIYAYGYVCAERDGACCRSINNLEIYVLYEIRPPSPDSRRTGKRTYFLYAVHQCHIVLHWRKLYEYNLC